jgi:hypothetical protein
MDSKQKINNMNKDFTVSFEFADGTETMIELAAEFTDGSFSHAFGVERIPHTLDLITFDDSGYTPAQCTEIQTAIDNGRFDDNAWQTLAD